MARSRFVSCVLTFIIGWVAGCIFIFFALSYRDKPFGEIQLVHFVQTTASRLHYHNFLYSDSTVAENKQHKLPDASKKKNSTDDQDEKLHIFLDWPQSDRDLTIHNYKMLESMLGAFPTADFRVYVAAPKEMLDSKFPHMLSITHFAKYEKRGYDISVLPTETKVKAKELANVGQFYRLKWFSLCCQSNDDSHHYSRSHRSNSTVMDRRPFIAPYHLLMYIRFLHLWRKGGMFSDLSFYFLSSASELRSIQQGYYIQTFCTENSRSQPLQSTSISSDCFSSTLLLFKHRRHIALTCVLAQYDDDTFTTCINSDLMTGGVQCVQHALQTCFTKENVVNELENSKSLEHFDDNPTLAMQSLTTQNWTWVVDKSTLVLWTGHLTYKPSDGGRYPYDESSLMAALVKQCQVRPSPPALLSPQQTVNVSRRFQPIVSFPLLSAISNRNSSFLGHINNQPTITLSSPAMPHNHPPDIAVVGFEASNAESLVSYLENDPRILPPLTGFHGSSNADTDSCYGLKHGDEVHQLRHRQWCFPLVDHSTESYFLLANGLNYYQNWVKPYVLYADNPMIKVVMMMRHPVGRLYAHYRRSFIQMKLNSGEQVDTGVVKKSKKQKKLEQQQRLRGFPTTTEEPVMSVTSKLSFDEFILSAIQDESSALGQLRQAFRNNTALHVLVMQYYLLQQQYQQCSDSSSKRMFAEQMLLASIYLPPIAHYLQAFGAHHQHDALDNINYATNQNLLLLKDDDLFTKPETLIMLRNWLHIYDASESHTQLTLGHSTGNEPSIPSEYEMSKDMYHKLIIFFNPFNERLANITGLNLTSWTMPSEELYPSLPEYSPGLNISRPLLWFEQQEQGTSGKALHSSMVQHLLPQRESLEDSRFNTTLGMLNTFR